MKVGKLENFWNKMGLKGCKWSSLNAPGTETPLSHPIFKVGWIPFSHYWTSGVIRIGLPVWKWKRWKCFWTKWAEGTANGPVWMPQALKILSLIQFWSWKNSLFPLLALWGSKKWLPSMKVEKMEKFGNKSGLLGCKWSSMNAQGTGNPLSYPFWDVGCKILINDFRKWEVD